MSYILPNAFAGFRLPTEQLKVIQIVPNSDISIGKYGSFPANQIVGRPYYLTFEIESENQLRVVPTVEVHRDALVQHDDDVDLTAQDDEPQSQTNQRILDDPANQLLTFEEIEELKSTSNGDDIVRRILESHSTIDQKTAFSLAKYTVRKNRKYLKRFTILPLDVSTLTDWLSKEREGGNHMELRNETLAMALCFANVYKAPDLLPDFDSLQRYLVVDDTGGLMVAAMAERMGILESCSVKGAGRHETSLTLVHSNTQPNLALLRYFDFDYNFPSPRHALSLHLKALSWRQLLFPESDQSCIQPETVSPEVLATWKSTRRGNHFRKHRRCSEMLSIVNETRRGGFKALIVASHMSATSILKNLVPLLAGGAKVVIFSPSLEPLADLADRYSTARRTAFLNASEQERSLTENFPVDPTTLLGASVLTTDLQNWQVLAGRSHPCMMSPGGAEGYLFVATRALRSGGKTQARGTTGGKKRRVVLEIPEI